MRKGQVELVIILAVLFLFAVVLMSGFVGNFMPSPVPSGVAERQASVSQTVLGVIGNGVTLTLKDIETHGGYLDDPSIAGDSWRDRESVTFMREGVPYWQMCENDYSQTKEQITRRFELSVAKYVKDNLRSNKDFFGANVTFDTDKILVKANILGGTPGEPRRVDVEVTLPTTVDGYQMPDTYQPYKLSVPTDFGEIVAFAQDYSKENAANRHLEIFTIYGVYFSEPLDRFGKLPTSGVLTECGQSLFRSPDQIDKYLLELVRHVVTQFEMWGSPPGFMTVDYNKPKVFAIPSVNGKEYLDIDVNFRLPDGFGFENHDFVMYVNNERINTNAVLSPPVCVKEFNRGYDVSYPLVISVKDKQTGNYFNFASHVFVKSNGYEMQPGSCSDITAPGQGECLNLPCKVKIKVVDDLMAPLEGAFVSYGGCPVDYTDSNGMVDGSSVCSGELDIYKNSTYEFYSETAVNQNLKSTYILHKVPNMTARFREVNMYIDYKPITGFGESRGVGDWQTCIPCGGSCQIGSVAETRTRCSIGLMDKEYMYVDFTPNYRDDYNMPITNIDGDSFNSSCMSSPACVECNRSSQSLDTVNPNLANAQLVQSYCQQCGMDCASKVLENRSVDYIPSGTYTAKGNVLNPFTFREAGGMIAAFTLQRNEDMIYINMPRSQTKTGNDYQVSDTEKACLTNYLKTCRIDPIATNDTIENTVVMQCSCTNLLDFVSESGLASETASMFCECPLGSPFDAGCCDRTLFGCAGVCCKAGEDCCKRMSGGECVEHLPVCTTCCDSAAVINYINSEQQQLKTKTRLICA